MRPIVTRRIRCIAFAMCAVSQWSCASQQPGLGRVSCSNPFPQLTTRMAALPSISPPLGSDGVVIVGYVADSATRNALSGAIIRLRGIDRAVVDTTTAYSDSAGGFAIRIGTRGRYQYSVLAVNFAVIRDSIDLRRDAETVRVVMRRGLPLCNVQLTRAR